MGNLITAVYSSGNKCGREHGYSDFYEVECKLKNLWKIEMNKGNLCSKALFYNPAIPNGDVHMYAISSENVGVCLVVFQQFPDDNLRTVQWMFSFKVV